MTNIKITFSRRTTNLPDGIKRQKTFEADSMIEILQQASNYWFGGQKVSDWRQSGSVVTLLSNEPNGNVINTLFIN